jgi:SHS2 domain-containing protein
MTKNYTTFDHTADLGIEVYGKDHRELFVNAGRALFDLITDLNKIEAHTSLSLNLKAIDREDLLVSWLRELLYFHQSEGYLLNDFVLHDLEEQSLRATVKGEIYETNRHELIREIKAVTYHHLKVTQEKERWVARIVFDI